MASRKLEDLTPDTLVKAQRMLKACDDAGINVLVYCTLRSLEEQAKLYRQSRSWAKIKEKMRSLESRGFGFLANVLDSVGPCSGPHTTYAGPGESFHNYAEAFDCVPMNGGRCLWSYKNNQEYWDAMICAGKMAGLTAGGVDFGRFKDRPHFQLRSGSNPLRHYEPDQIKNMLQQNGLL